MYHLIRMSSIFRKKRWYLLLLLVVSILIFAFVPWIPKLYFSPITVKRRIKKDVYVNEKVGPAQPNWSSYQSISKHLFNAVVASEDTRFYEHKGLDFSEIKKSFEKNIKRKKYARGASTITQQVVKMTLLSREKTLLRKAREATGALILDAVMSKSDILTWYINLVEFGQGVYGVQKAASYYFSTKPHLLSVAQSIHLALVLPSPERWSVGLRKKSLTTFGHRRFAVILLRMKQLGYITDQQWRETLATGDFGRPIQGYENFSKDLKDIEETTPSPGEPEHIGAIDKDLEEDDVITDDSVNTSPQP